MADKPRVKAPKQRATQRRAEDEAKRRQTLMIAGAGLVALVAVVGVALLLGIGGGRPSEEDARAALQEAGCTLQVEEALPGAHSIRDPDGTSDAWNTDPPTSGPHFGTPVIWGEYEEPVQPARAVHNLEHGGIWISYGDDVPPSEIESVRRFYRDDPVAMLLAPMPDLGDEIALAAWFQPIEGEEGEPAGVVAKYKRFDEPAFEAFRDTYRFKGPERFAPEDLEPGE